jgi:DNA-binding CsgD family transcriptional regulator
MSRTTKAIPDHVRDKIRDLAWEGYSSREIAERVGVSRATAATHAQGLLRPRAPEFTTLDIQQIYNLYVGQGLSVNHTAAMVGHSNYGVRQFLQREGLIRVENIRPRLSRAEQGRILVFWSLGRSQRYIADRIGRSPKTVARFLRRQAML